MGANVVEVVAGDELSHQRVVGIAQSVATFATHLRLVEAHLIAQPSSRSAIGHTRIHLHVETLLGSIVSYRRRGQSVESVHDEYPLLRLRHVVARYHLRWEALATLVHGSHVE